MNWCRQATATSNRISGCGSSSRNRRPRLAPLLGDVSVPESATVNCRSRSVSAPLNRSLARSLAASQKTEIEVLSSSIASTQHIRGREYTFYPQEAQAAQLSPRDRAMRRVN